MKKLIISLILFIFILALSGCAFIDKLKDVERLHGQIYKAPYSQVWAAIPGVLNQRRFAVMEENKAESYIFARRYPDDWSFGIDMGVFIDKAPDSAGLTRVMVVTQYLSIPPLIGRYDWESDFLYRLDYKLKQEQAVKNSP